jgi:hypothetical protein
LKHEIGREAFGIALDRLHQHLGAHVGGWNRFVYAAGDTPSFRIPIAQGNTQRLHRGICGLDPPLQFLIDQPYQCAEFSATRVDLLRVIRVLRADEFLKTRIRTLHNVKAVDVITSLQRERFGAVGFGRFGERGNVSHHGLQGFQFSETDALNAN